MFRIVVAAAVVAAGAAPAAEPSKAEVKKLAIAMGDAMKTNDVGTILDHTYPALVEQMGGRKKALKTLKSMLKVMKARGIEFKKYELGDPEEFVTEGDNTFIVVSSVLEMASPMGTIRGRSFLLGISGDGGKTWKFADGAGVNRNGEADKVLPKLPAKLKLPPDSKPELVKE